MKPEAPVTRTGTGRKTARNHTAKRPRETACDTLPTCMRVGALVGRGRRLLERLSRRIRRVESRVVTMAPPSGTGKPVEPVGRALLSYILDPYLLAPDRPEPHSHTHFWESREIGRILIDLGFEVDVVHWTNRTLHSRAPYDLFVDVRLNLERLAPAARSGLPQGHAHRDRALRLLQPGAAAPARRARRRGAAIRLAPYKLLEPNRAIEHADAATILSATAPPRRPTPTPASRSGRCRSRSRSSIPSPTGKDFAAARRRFLWFGSGGLLHKGLDRVLEVFAVATRPRAHRPRPGRS